MRRAGVRDAKIVKGWFAQTLSRTAIDERIAILRMDGDWYDSTLCILENLFHQVVPGGCVIVDDYHCWDGCARAVHDFLSREKRPERIRTFNDRVAFMVKQA
jgi:O-methyltransferase